MPHVQTSQWTVSDAIHWVYDSYNRAKPQFKGGFDRDVRHPEWTSRLLDVLERPDHFGCNVAVAGSKGKGSHATLLAALLQRVGLKVGLFTGPHLVDFLERIRVDGEAISEEDFVRCIRQVAQAADPLSLPQGQYFGPVGLVAAAAAVWFRSAGTAVNVYECGRGALHDDVNQIRHSGAVLTPIFLEHAAQLGPSLTDVVNEKMGVLTRDTEWLCSAAQSEDVMVDIDRQRTFAAFRVHGVHFRASHSVVGGHVHLQMTYPEAVYDVVLPDADGYIADNAAVAFDAARTVWMRCNPNLAMPTSIDISHLRLAGRLQVLSRAPWVLLDGTIHEQSAAYIRDMIIAKKKAGKMHHVTAVLCLPADKQGDGVVRTLSPVVDRFVFTGAHNPHLRFDDRFAKMAEVHRATIEMADFVEDAVARSVPMLAPSDGLLLLGTQSFVGDTLRLFGKDTRSVWR